VGLSESHLAPVSLITQGLNQSFKDKREKHITSVAPNVTEHESAWHLYCDFPFL